MLFSSLTALDSIINVSEPSVNSIILNVLVGNVVDIFIDTERVNKDL